MKKRIVFMGTPAYASMIFQTLIKSKDIEVVLLFTQPDKLVGRKKILTPPQIKLEANSANIPVLQPISLKNEDFSSHIKKVNPDFIIVAAFGQILPQLILDIAPCINLHASLLPAYRGASPIYQSLLAGETKTGVTAIVMNSKMDSGNIITAKTFDIPSNMLCFELFNALSKIAAILTLEVIKNFDNFTIIPQEDSKATYCKKIKKSDGKIIFDDAKNFFNIYKAFTPWPGIYLESGLKLKKVSLADVNGYYKPGQILKIEKEYIEVGCAKGSLYLYKVQPVSKKEMNIVDYLNGKRLKIADILA